MISTDDLIAALRQIPSRDGLMNPYHSDQGRPVPAIADEIGPEADRVRTRNLRNYLATLLGAGSDVLFCGEAPSAVGQIWTGVAFTSERELLTPEFPLEGCSLLPGARSGDRPLMKEPSALYIWRALRRMKTPAVLCNALAAHPFPLGEPARNRTPKSDEVAIGSDSLRCLIDLIRPRLIVAVGQTAERALGRLGVQSVTVRHPSYGGSTQMMRQLEELGLLAPESHEAQQALP
jgi:uracil-DNA glycosylase